MVSFGTLGRTSPRGVGTRGGRDWRWLSCAVVEQRLNAVRAVLAGSEVTEGGREFQGESVDGASVSGPVSD